MLNKIIVMGRLTHDPELRRTGSGTPVCSFSIACDRDFKSQSGEKETDFFDVVAWRANGEFVSKYFTKGRMVFVWMRIRLRVESCFIVIISISLLSGRRRYWPIMTFVCKRTGSC